MHGEMELNRDDRKQLAELMLEYPSKQHSQDENAQQDENPPRTTTEEIHIPQLQPAL